MYAKKIIWIFAICTVPAFMLLKISEAIQVQSWVRAFKKYHEDCGSFPTEQQGLQALREKPKLAPIPDNWKGPYILKTSTYTFSKRQITYKEILEHALTPSIAELTIPPE